MAQQAFRFTQATDGTITIGSGGAIAGATTITATGLITGAGLDVWYQYPERGKSEVAPSKFPFHQLENVVMSPHRGGYAKGLLPHFDEAIENLNNYVEGKPLINIIDINDAY